MFSAVHDGVGGGGVPPEVHGHLHSFERLQLQVIKKDCTRQPAP